MTLIDILMYCKTTVFNWRGCKLNKHDLILIKNSKLFDLDYYSLLTNLKFNSKDEAISHYIEIGYKEGFNPSANFDGNLYLKKYPHIQTNPLLHYIKYGKTEGKNDCFKLNDLEYNLIKDLSLFDLEFYQTETNKEYTSYFEAFVDYLEYGYKQNFNPSELFDGNEYLKIYPDVKNANKNPLFHYVKYGINEGRYFSKEQSFSNFKQLTDVNSVLEHVNNEVSIIVLINDIDKVIDCIKRIYQTTENFKIILINFKYPEDSMSCFDKFENVKIHTIKNSEKIITTLNSIIDNDENDIVFLDENIITFKNWVRKLIFAAYSNYRVGFAAPVSNYAGVKLTKNSNNESFVNNFNNISKKEYNSSPFPNSSCIYIKRDVFRGGLKFEECGMDSYLYQFYQIAEKKGWRLVLDDSNYVYYNHNTDKKDFSDKYLLKNLPNIDFLNSNTFKSMYNMFQAIENKSETYDKNVLFSMHNGGGVEYTVKEIINSIDDKYNCYLLKSQKDGLFLFKLIGKCMVLKEKFILKYSWNPTMIHNEEFKQIYFYILVNYNIDLVQIDHSIFHTFDLAEICKILNIPTVLTIHDFYYICPTYFLLDENYVYCGGHCGSKPRNCSSRVEWFELPANIVEWKQKWQEYVQNLFKTVNAIVTATQFTKDLFLEHYTNLNDEDIHLIEHGSNLIKYSNLYSTPNMYQPIKILIPGVISRHKGSEFIKELKKIDSDNRLEFHFMGIADKELQKIGIYHGRYKREDFSKNVYKIKPSFIGIFSICAETYSYTLSESISSGIPVFASNIGALKSRIEKNGGGWLVDFTNPEKTYKQILDVVKNKTEYKKKLNEVKNIELVSSKEMANNYEKLYQKLLQKYHGD